MASPDERAFVVFPRGYVRDNIILANFRNYLRLAVNPETGMGFTEDEVIRATSPGTRFYIDADSVDLFGQASQQRAVFFAAQIDPRLANGVFLEKFHGELWLGPDSRLPATGASGVCLATGVDGTLIPGSTTVPDPAAAVATDPNGLRYQNTVSVTIAAGVAQVALIGLDTGFVTRLPVDTELRWSLNTNPGTDPTLTVTTAFDGGFDAETDEEYSTRIVQRIRHRPASGNAVHFQAWAQQASSAVEQAFVYPCALHAGSVVVAVTEKRPDAVEGVTPEGPLARIPSLATLNTVAAFLTPPSSPVVPETVFVLVASITAQPSDIVLRVAMATGRSGGWADVNPWPTYSDIYEATELSAVSVDGLTLSFVTDQSLPGEAASLTGVDVPSLMLFNEEISRWVQLEVTSVTDPNPGTTIARTFVVVLSSLPTLFDEDGDDRLPVVGDRISPYTDRADIMAEAIEAYFDSLGPGEVVDVDGAVYPRAARRPVPSTAYPMRAGQGILRYLLQGLGGTAADAELTQITRNEPDLPTNITDGPNLVTFGATNVFPL